MRHLHLLEKVMNSDSYVRYAVVLDSKGILLNKELSKNIENFLPLKQMGGSFKHAANA